jgi:outer membrane protein assembly factor BamD
MQKLVIVSLLGLLLFSACSRFEAIRRSPDMKQKLASALAYYEKKDYYRAGILLEDVIPLLKGSAEAEDAQFKYAYCQYYQGLLELSAFHFNKFYETFARSPHAQEARYMYAYSLYEGSPVYYLDQTNTYKAIDALQAFINAYPESEYTEKSQKLLHELRKKLEKKSYEQARLFYRIQDNHKAAVVTFNNFQKSFPDSDYNEEVAFRKLEANYDLAFKSTETKQRERYQTTIDFYETFIDKYPNSRFSRQAESIYIASMKALGTKNVKRGSYKKKKETEDTSKTESSESNK